MDTDERYEELRMAQLDFIEDYFLTHVYRITADGSRIAARTNYKIGESYIIKYTLSPNDATFTLDIPRDLYDKVNNYVITHDIDNLTYEEINKEIGI